jgi:hypothetical protein
MAFEFSLTFGLASTDIAMLVYLLSQYHGAARDRYEVLFAILELLDESHRHMASHS